MLNNKLRVIDWLSEYATSYKEKIPHRMHFSSNLIEDYRSGPGCSKEG